MTMPFVGVGKFSGNQGIKSCRSRNQIS
jgi:hypothetical protein